MMTFKFDANKNKIEDLKPGNSNKFDTVILELVLELFLRVVLGCSG